MIQAPWGLLLLAWWNNMIVYIEIIIFNMYEYRKTLGNRGACDPWTTSHPDNAKNVGIEEFPLISPLSVLDPQRSHEKRLLDAMLLVVPS